MIFFSKIFQQLVFSLTKKEKLNRQLVKYFQPPIQVDNLNRNHDRSNFASIRDIDDFLMFLKKKIGFFSLIIFCNLRTSNEVGHRTLAIYENLSK